MTWTSPLMKPVEEQRRRAVSRELKPVIDHLEAKGYKQADYLRAHRRRNRAFETEVETLALRLIKEHGIYVKDLTPAQVLYVFRKTWYEWCQGRFRGKHRV